MSLSKEQITVRCDVGRQAAWELTCSKSKRLRELSPLMVELAQTTHDAGYVTGFTDGADLGYEARMLEQEQESEAVRTRGVDVQVRVASRIDNDEPNEEIQVFRAEPPFIVYVSTNADGKRTVLTLSVDSDGRVASAVVKAT